MAGSLPKLFWPGSYDQTSRSARPAAGAALYQHEPLPGSTLLSPHQHPSPLSVPACRTPPVAPAATTAAPPVTPTALSADSNPPLAHRTAGRFYAFPPSFYAIDSRFIRFYALPCCPVAPGHPLFALIFRGFQLRCFTWNTARPLHGIICYTSSPHPPLSRSARHNSGLSDGLEEQAEDNVLTCSRRLLQPRPPQRLNSERVQEQVPPFLLRQAGCPSVDAL